MSLPLDRPGAREAGPELLVLAHWEQFIPWLLDHTRKWPKSARFTLTQRIENHALDLTEALVLARYEPDRRRRLLREVNLLLERMRHLCRIARDLRIMPKSGFETAMREIDTAGRMTHGWRVAIGERSRRPPAISEASS